MGKTGRRSKLLALEKEQRIDPADGQQLTWEQLQQKYCGQYLDVHIAHYWYNKCKRVPQVASKANLRSTVPQPKAEKKEATKPSALRPDQDKVKAEDEAAAKAKAEREAVAQAKIEQEAAAKAKVEQEAAAKAAKATVIKSAADEAVKTAEAAAQAKPPNVHLFTSAPVATPHVVLEEAAAKAAKAKEAAAKETRRLEVAHIRNSSNASSEVAPEVKVKAPGPFFASFMVWLGDLTSKLCKANKKLAEEMPRQQLPEQAVGA